MNDIQRQVRNAQWRINLGRLGWALVWFLGGSFSVTVLLWLVPKIWPWETMRSGLSADQWYWGTATVTLAIGVLAGLVSAWRRRTQTIDAAIEVDRRFGLRERISSALWLPVSEQNTEVGQALMADAQARAKRIAISDEFKFHPRWSSALPLLPLAILCGLYFIPDAQPKPGLSLTQVAENREKVKVEVEEIKKLVTEKAKELEERGLNDLAEQMEAIAKRFDQQNGDPETIKKDALIKINDLRRQIEEQQKQVGDSESLKASLDQLKKVTKGTGEKMAEALAAGDLQAAKKAVEELAKKLASGELNEMEKKQLADNLQQMANEIKKMQERQEEAKRELENQMNQARQQGNLQKAADLQKKLDQLEKNQQAMQKMQQLAQRLEKTAQAMQQTPQQQKQNQQGESAKNDAEQKSGEQKNQQQMEQAQKALEDLAQEMEDLGASMEAMEALKDLEQDFQEVKDGMGPERDGNNPNGKPNGEPKWKDGAKDGGDAGGGKRDIEENETKEYRSRVAGKIQKGETVISGTADGENLTGKSLLEVRDMVQSSMSQQTDPLEDQQLPRNQREHARQYFEGLRKGK